MFGFTLSYALCQAYIDQMLRIGAREQAQEQERYIAAPVTFAVALQLITIRSVARARARASVALILETACRRVGRVMTCGATRISRVHANVRCNNFVNAYRSLSLSFSPFTCVGTRRYILISIVVHS